MPFSVVRTLLLTYFICCLQVARPLLAQILSDREAMVQVQSTIHHIYNYEFGKASISRQQVENRYPGHPVMYFMRAFQLYWQYLPIQNNKTRVAEYIQNLHQCLAAVDRHYGKESTDPEAVFFRLASRGYLALLYNFQGELLKAAGEGQKVYGSLTEALALTEKNPEFYFIAGTYNYYVEAYPEDHPMVKPVMLFFKNGDKKLGLKQLDLSTSKAVITQVEAAYFLAQTYLDHESRPDLAVKYTAPLISRFPANPIFRMIHLQSLLLAGRYQEAEKELPALKKHTGAFFPSAWHVFDGRLQEKKEQNYPAAQRSYQLALQIPYDAQFTKEYHAMAYAGLARLAARTGDKGQARNFYKKCLSLTEYKSTRQEARNYLR